MGLLSFAADAVIPPWVKPLAIGIAVVVALGAAATGGATVNGWRLDADHQRAMTAEKARYDALVDTVREQNRAVEALGAAKQAADGRRELAERYAAGIIGRIGTREQAVANSQATNCDGVLRDAWKSWQ